MAFVNTPYEWWTSWRQCALKFQNFEFSDGLSQRIVADLRLIVVSIWIHIGKYIGLFSDVTFAWVIGDKSSARSCGIHLRGISHEMLNMSIRRLSFKITYLLW